MATPDIQPIRQESTSELIARTLRDAISRGKFAPGEQLLEADLAAQFGVSRGPLREAMQRLTQEGLVMGRRNKGLFVAEFDREEVFDIYTARLAIERAACLKVIDVTGKTDELYRDLTDLTDQLETRSNAGAKDEELAELDVKFHEHLVEASDSPRLIKFHSTLATETRMCIAEFETPSYPLAERIKAHRQIADAIHAKDISKLNRALADHMDHAVEHISRAQD